MRHARSRGPSVILVALSLIVPSAFGATTIEVDVDGTFTPLERAVVPTASPVVRISRDADIPSMFSVLLTREDGRAGFGGAGKTITVGASGSGAMLEESPPGSEVYIGSLRMPVGVNTLRIQPAGGGADLLTATMLNYSRAYEDINGDGILDYDEDGDGDGVLDAGEDGNGNQFLDVAEDANGNGQLDLDEDIDGDTLLDPGEDLNSNGMLDATVVLPVDAILDMSSTVSHPYGFAEQGESVILEFRPTASDVDAGNFLRGVLLAPGLDLRPVGLSVDDVTYQASTIVTARIVGGPVPHEVARRLNGQPPGDYTFPPPTTPPPPLRDALVNGIASPGMTAGERMPQRLQAGAAPNAGEGYNGMNGGFDDNGDNPDELDAAWNHFLVQTYSAHRLMEVLPFPAAPDRLCVIDTGFGNGSNNLPDVPAARIVLPHNHAPVAANPGLGIVGNAAGAKANLGQIPDDLGFAAGTHGTQVAELSSGDGTVFTLGTGWRTPLRPIRTDFSDPSLNNSLNTGGADANTSVVSCSWTYTAPAPNAAAGRARVQIQRGNLRVGLARVLAQGQIAVICAGNSSEDTERAYPAIFTVPSLAGTAIDDDLDAMNDEDPVNGMDDDGDLAVDEDPPETPQALAVGATGVDNLPLGPERYASSFSNTGVRVLISAPGQGVRSVNANFPAGTAYTFSAPINGCSFATPQVAGAIAELDNVAAALPAGLFSGGGVTAAQRRLRVAQIVMATADDLGTTNAAAGVDHVSDDAGNGPDGDFGFGRLNLWKATLSVANQGLSAQHARDLNADNLDDRFPQLPIINDANTQWYGFEIVTSERQATVWIDGTRLADAGTNGMDGAPGGGDDLMPLAPNITAYKGVRSDMRMERGVHDLSDGSSEDPVVAGAAGRPGRVVEEDPLTGIVPVGTQTNNRGEYVMTFSIQRADLYSGGQPRTLSLRRRGAGVDGKPIFNLRLDTALMRTGTVSGVTFDDFVLQIVPPDYGDAAIAPTLLRGAGAALEGGARHHNGTLEWLGKLEPPGLPPADPNPNLKGVSPEHDADFEAMAGDARVDVDGVTNRKDFHDRDGRDDGVLFFPLTYRPGAMGKVQFTIRVHDATSTRYGLNAGIDPMGTVLADKSLFVNMWIDWDTDGVWEEDAEHVINGLQINPRGPWTIEAQGINSMTVALGAASADGNARTFESDIPVGPAIGCGLLWARARLDYGENVGRNDPLPMFRSLPSMRSLAAPVVPGLAGGAARYGEVEDYFIGSDFGDAPDPFQATAGRYPTLRANLGARHLDTHQEWIGTASTMKPQVSREVDADDAGCSPGGGTDQDTKTNLKDQDGLEPRGRIGEGVVIPPIVRGRPVTIQIPVVSSVGARGAAPNCALADSVGAPEDAADSLPRYCRDDPRRRLYLSGWADWNGDGVWAAAEKILDTTVDPQTSSPNGQYTLGEPFDDTNRNGVRDPGEGFTDAFGKDQIDVSFTVPVPATAAAAFYMRFRLAYGEDEMTADLPVKESDEDARANAQEKGGALCGEVEDHPVSTTPWKGYKTRPKPREPRFPRMQVNLVDQFATSTATVLSPSRFFTPADKNGEGIADPTAHLMCYRIREGSFARRQVLVRNEFGDQTLTVLRPDTLCNPAEEVGVPRQTNGNHFKCYQARGRGFVTQTLTLADQFETLAATLVEPRLLCNPVDKNGEGIVDAAEHLTCYTIRDDVPFTPRDVTVMDQFAEENLRALRGECRRRSVVCLRSEKSELF